MVTVPADTVQALDQYGLQNDGKGRFGTLSLVEPCFNISRRIFKLALRLPVRTHTADLLKLAEAQEFPLFVRLSGTAAGRAILGMLGRNPTVVSPDAVKSPTDVTSKVFIPRMPRNMHPTYNEERIRARGKALLASARLDKYRTCFVNAASFVQKAFSTVVVDCDASHQLRYCPHL
ncbi:hypothetical protein HPB50_014210 [Hyalomma asiaticum]|uniref:Uncharacterized protein n=1 Tax=Hyalomma asiaticum TaxID=266040 RepID=A0ACB7TKE1_HYAAI|nr:hypothetical protein HPB50_014210 [Hyalomma asiaticum]